MQLTLKGDYAVRVVVDLAAQPGDATVKIRDLWRRTGVPPAFLGKIVQELARAGLVRTRRGALGGVALSRAPRTISLRDVIEAVEGPIYLNRCLIRPGLCQRDRFCPVHSVWARIQALVTRELESVCVEELALAPLGRAAARRRAASC
jgi:Rrf2 family protein